MKFEIRKAERKKAKLRAAIVGVSGSGKTYSSLMIAKGMGGRICVIDTENKSADFYANEFDYDVLELSAPFDPRKYIEAIKAVEDSGYDIIIIDSLTHAWSGAGGLLDMTDTAAQSQRSQNSYVAWKQTTPIQNKMVDAILQSKCHVIATMRCKTHYDMQENEKGKKVPVKVGLAPIQRDGMEYEFTILFDIQLNHYCFASKDRTNTFSDAFIPTVETGEKIIEWLNSGKSEEDIKKEKSSKEEEDLIALSIQFSQKFSNSTTSEELRSYFREFRVQIKPYLDNHIMARKYLEELTESATRISKNLDSKLEDNNE